VVFFFIYGLSCSETGEFYNLADFDKIEKIDVHVHANSKNPSFLEQAKTDNFRLISVNVDYPDFPPIEEQLQIAIELQKLFPDRIAYASTFSMEGWDGGKWQQNVIHHLDQTFAKGAIAVKVWKNIGMDFKDKNGNLVMIDNSKFDSIFLHLKMNNIPLIGHQGEPKNCWLPLEEMTVINDREYFKSHPQYHMYLHPEFPSYEDQMNARDRMLDKNMEFSFIGAHLASLEWSVEELAKFLDRFPNAVVDMAARMGQIQYQSLHDRDRVRDFFLKYQNTILYATDLTHEADADQVEFKKEVNDKWETDWKFLTADEIMTAPEVEGEFQGLAIPENIIDKIYRKNAERIFHGIFKN